MNEGIAMEATAKAHTNIALIKYWGKRDEKLLLPMNGSLSITLDKFYTTTTVQYCEDLKKDVVVLNNQLANESDILKISPFLNLIRNLAGKNIKAIVKTVNHVPTAAGFASSASGFAALAAAATKAIGLNLDDTALSILARQGSGSACRSIFGGFVEWKKGVQEDGEDSFSQPILAGQNWKLSILSVLLTDKQKQISSREAMRRTVETSPYYSSWVTEAKKDLQMARDAIDAHDFTGLGQVVEANALKMHATMLSANPPFCYWHSATLDVMEQVRGLRDEGIAAYYTIDAGPNVKVLCQPEDETRVLKRLLSIPSVRDVYVCHPGPGVIYLSNSNSKINYSF